MKVLVVDVGGTHVKILATSEDTRREFPSSPTLTASQMVSGVKKLAKGWSYDVVSIGYPGPVLHGRPMAEPRNLGRGWVGFDYRAAFGRPVTIVNDAAMQALGSYKGGRMLFLGLGTGLGSAMIVDGIIEPMELGHLPYKKATYEDYVGLRGLEKFGKKKWRARVAEVVALLIAALDPEDVVLGGGNVKKLKALPPGCRAGGNANSFLGGFRLWNDAGHRKPSASGKEHSPHAQHGHRPAGGGRRPSPSRMAARSFVPPARHANAPEGPRARRRPEPAARLNDIDVSPKAAGRKRKNRWRSRRGS